MHSVCASKGNHQNNWHIIHTPPPHTHTHWERERLTFASQSRPIRATRKSTRTIIIPITRISLILEPVNEHVSHSCKRSRDTCMYKVQVEACKQCKVTVSVYLSPSTYDDQIGHSLSKAHHIESHTHSIGQREDHSNSTTCKIQPQTMLSICYKWTPYNPESRTLPSTRALWLHGQAIPEMRTSQNTLNCLKAIQNREVLPHTVPVLKTHTVFLPKICHKVNNFMLLLRPIFRGKYSIFELCMYSSPIYSIYIWRPLPKIRLFSVKSVE